MRQNIGTILSICNFVLITILVFSISTSSQKEELSKSTVQESTSVEFGGVLRPNAEGSWTILDDADHTSIGLSHIEQNEDSIKLFFDDSHTLTKIHWVSVTIDETLAQEELFVGASVGLDHMVIQMVKDGKVVRPDEYTNRDSNLWVYVRGDTQL